MVAYTSSPHTDYGILAEQKPGPELFLHAMNNQPNKKNCKQDVYSRLE